MTNQEARGILANLEADYRDLNPLVLTNNSIQLVNERIEALGMAISALQAQEALQLTCNNLATDTISRRTAQERQRVAQKRKYTFGNDEFSLEAAYHDCKFVFDGITDDNSFQEADTGLVLYYANEIIYALHEALEGKDTKQPEPSEIARDIATIIENERDMRVILKNSEPCEDAVSRADVEIEIANLLKGVFVEYEDIAKKVTARLPSVTPKRKTGKWIEEQRGIKVTQYKCSECGRIVIGDTTYDVAEDYPFCHCGADMRGEQDDKV